MTLDVVMAWAEALIFDHTRAHLTELQRTILQQVWHDKPYTAIALYYGCTEGHAKDTGADLWKLLSAASGTKISKRNFRAVATRHCKALHTTKLLPPDSQPDQKGRFIGRSQDLAHLQTLVQQGINTLLIQGEGGVGKTTLANQYLHSQGCDRVLELLIAKDTHDLTPVETIVEEWLRRDFNEDPGGDFSVTLSRLKRHLQQQRIGVLIDNLEPALDQTGRIIAAHRNYAELLRVLTDTRNQSVTLITSRDRLCEAGITIEHYRLAGLSTQAWQTYWEGNQIQAHPSTLDQMHHTYGGNAKAMQIVSGIIREDYHGNAQLYWQEASQDPLQSMALKNLVSSQMDRLSNLDPEAYQLLLRLSCYRFQAHPTLPKAGLIALLWDIDPSRHAQVIQSIRNRSLVEFHCGDFWLHPVIRAEAIARLKQNQDFHKASQQAANYWTHSITTITSVEDALKAWEAFYHYVEIQDFDAASQVILQSHHNQWQQYLPLGSLLYRMGLSQRVLSAIHQILDQVQSQSNISELNNILGDLYWITGRISDAIACQETSLKTSTTRLGELINQAPDSENPKFQHQVYYFRMLRIDSLFSLGLYHIDLWDLPCATSFLQQVIDLGQKTQHERWAEKASVCLALVKSYQGEADALSLAQPIVNKIHSAQSPAYAGPFAYFIQRLGQTYANLGQLRQAQTLYEIAIAYAQEIDYQQLIAVTTTSLAELDRNRQNYDVAIRRHQKATQLLDDMGAICDLANAYFQWGVTVEQMQHPAEQQFEKAIALFRRIGAPLQIQRVVAIWKHSPGSRDRPNGYTH